MGGMDLRFAGRIGLMLVLGLTATALHAQQHWLAKFQGVQAAHISDVAVDAAGNTYVTGDISSTATVSKAGATLATLPTAGGPDVLVAKFAPDGALLWAVHGGGPSVDLGLKLTMGPAGLAVTGLFTGTADLFGVAAQAQGAGSDLFVALLDPMDGEAYWVRTAGAPGYTDTPGGIAIAPNGEVVVAGKFKGEATFGSVLMQSADDPATGQPSFDVFIAAWAADGTFQWAKQGTGTKDCTATDIVAAPDGHLYMAGQFSETITFDATHPGTVQNGIFLLKAGPQGQEQWFRTMVGGAYNRISDLHWSAEGNLLMAGDVGSTMLWSDGSSNTPLTNTSPHAYFIVRVSPEGDLIGHKITGSSSPVHAAALTEQADSVVVLGDFSCAFTGLQDFYGVNGLFRATGAPDLFIAKHAGNGLGLVRAQQFAGPGAKTGGGLASTPDGLIFGGSFGQFLYLPRGEADWGDPVGGCNFLAPNQGLTFCGDPNYGKFAWASGTNVASGFLTKGFVEGRSPYDFWDRSGLTACNRDALDHDVQITLEPGGPPAPDTVALCPESKLWSHVPFPRGDGETCPIDAPTVGPFAWQQWSNGTSLSYTFVGEEGWLRFQVDGTNDCWAWADSVYVELLPGLPASVSNSSGTWQQVPISLPVEAEVLLCGPTAFWLDQPVPDGQVFWIHQGDTLHCDTVLIQTSGTYELHVKPSDACETGAVLHVEMVVPLNVTGVTSELLADTVWTCNAACAHGAFANTWWVDGVETELPPGYLVTYQSGGACNQSGTADANDILPWGIQVNGSGWYVVQSEVTLQNATCGTGPFSFTFSDSVYVAVGTVPELLLPQTAVGRCIDDTVAVPIICIDCDTIYWSSPNVWMTPGMDTVMVPQDDTYFATAVSFAGASSCMSGSVALVVAAPTPPTLFPDPPSGQVCPNEAMLLYTDAVGSSYTWTGPGTANLPDADSIWVTEPGDYYLSVELYPGCSTSNGPVTLSFHGSPIITGQPAGVICPGGTLVLEVTGAPDLQVQWLPPLSGTGPTRTVDAAGTYTCVVQSCGGTWTLSYVVTASTVSADLGADTFTLCGGPVVLTATPGGSYLWLPPGATGQGFTVTTPGTYELIVTDPNGCSASSGPITVLPDAITVPGAFSGDSICLGQQATVMAIGSGALRWFTTHDTTELLLQGDHYTYMPLATDTLYFVQTEGGCAVGPYPVIVFVQEPPPAPIVTGNTAPCQGDTLLLEAEGIPGSTLVWQTPAGSFEGGMFGPLTAGLEQAGNYACHALLGGCPGDTALWSVEVLDCSPDIPDGTLPNVITPNGDGVNDHFRLNIPDLVWAELQIYNRWGQLVALLKGSAATWDGRNSFSGEPLPEGVYFYILEATTRSGEQIARNGHVHLLR